MRAVTVFSYRYLWLHQRLLQLLPTYGLLSILDRVIDGPVISKVARRVLGDAVVCVECEEQWGQETPLGSASAEGLGCGGELSQPQQPLQSTRVLVILRELAGLSKVEQIG